MPNDNEIYASMIQARGREYRSDQIKPYSHYREPIDHSPGRLAGNSRVGGDASPEVQSRSIDTLIEASQRAGLNPRETAHVLAIARYESGFNPDAASNESAAGLGQFLDRTGRGYGLNNQNRFDAGEGSRALVEHFIDNRDRANRLGQGEEYIYAYHHDGARLNSGGLALSQANVIPNLDAYEQFVRQRLGQQQTTDQQVPRTTQPRTGQTQDGQTPRPERTTGQTERPQSRDAMADGVLRQGERGADVKGLQESLNTLGVKDANGNRLAQDSTYGKHTKEAVENFQRANGLKVDGIAGKDTLSAIGNKLPEGKVTVDASGVTGPDAKIIAPDKPLISDAKHPNHALFEAISAKLPAGTKPEVAANITLQSLENGITGPDKLARVDISGSDAFVQGSVAGDRAKVDLTAPTPTLQQMSDHMAQQSQRAQQQQPPLEQQRTQILQ